MDLCWKGILVDKCLDIKLFGIVDILNVIEKVVICLYDENVYKLRNILILKSMYCGLI